MITKQTLRSIKELIDEHGVSYEEYVGRFEEQKQVRRWKLVYDKVVLTEKQKSILSSPSRQIHAVTFSSDWCADCLRAVPPLENIISNSDFIDHTILDRDAAPELFGHYLSNAEKRIPVVLILGPDYHEICRWTERSVSAYILYMDTMDATQGMMPEDRRKALTVAFSAKFDDLVHDTVNELMDLITRAYAMVNSSSRLAKLEAASQN